MPRMKVAFLASTLKLGGAERITGEISRRLPGHGIDPVWAILKEPGPEGEKLKARGIPLVSGLARSRIDPLAVVKLNRLFRREKVDAAYCLDHQNAAVLGSMAARAAGVSRLFLAIHTTGLWGGRSSLPAGIRKVIPSFSRIIAVAEGQKRYLVEKERIEPDRIVVIRNGIDLQRYAATDERIRRGGELRAALGAGPATFVIGIVAALRPEKAHEVLLLAVRKLFVGGRDVVVVIVGDGPERRRLEEFVRARRFESAVRFLGARDDVEDLLQAFDVVVLSSHPQVETLPLAVMEAMAAGRPVVATRVGSVEELVEDNVTGCLVPPGPSVELEGALKRLQDDPPLRRAFGARAAERARDFDIDGTVRRTAALLKGEL
jgi:glycosyltransferase involved in cell wall biosynthesis